MATSGKGTGIAVDAEHHQLIVAHEVTNVGTDRAQLTFMGRKARDAIQCEEVASSAEGILDKMPAALDRMPDAMTIRRQTVEHPFGTLKAWMRDPLPDQDPGEG